MKVQILNFPTPFRTSQYLIFSPSESNIKAQRSKIVKKNQQFEKFLNASFGRISNNPPHFDMQQNSISTLKFLFHALEWANCCSKVVEKCAFSRNYAFQYFCKIPWILPKNLKILWIQREIEGYSKFQLLRLWNWRNVRAKPSHTFTSNFVKFWILKTFVFSLNPKNF